ncbi:helix-turn-helix domain-containing protein [Enterococcus sp. LJL128]|uniref:helix-turn-helix domain-containing protein n=1 Tax=Enterococcus sp. LJL51 TaxID=3416656 RepID=UPI003CFB23B0
MLNRLIELRKSLRLNQEDFGTRLGVTKSTVSNWEKGKRIIPESTRRLMIKEFNVDPLWLDTGKGNMFSESEDAIMRLFDEVNFGDNEFHRNLFRAFSKFDKSEWDALESMIDKINAETKKQTD